MEKENKKLLKIKDLNPKFENWEIKSKLVFKGELLPYETEKGKGFRINFIFEDDSGKIFCVAFKENAVYFQNFLKLNSIYHISGARIKNNKYDQEKFDLIFDKNSTKITCIDSDILELPLNWNFVNPNLGNFFGIKIY